MSLPPAVASPAPRWGRNGESASEDPLFNALYGAAYAEGAQVDAEVPGFLRAIVTLKHWGAPLH